MERTEQRPVIEVQRDLDTWEIYVSDIRWTEYGSIIGRKVA